jgi:hypothetical protein
MPNTPALSQEEPRGGPAAIYVCLYMAEPVARLTEQLQGCLGVAAAQQQHTLEIYGDIENPKISVEDIPLSYPPYQLTITEITPHNGKWSGFRLRATRRSEEAT